MFKREKAACQVRDIQVEVGVEKRAKAGKTPKKNLRKEEEEYT